MRFEVKNLDNDEGPSALVLLFLAILAVLFLSLEYADDEALRAGGLLDSLEQFCPQGHLDSEQEPHRAPSKYFLY